MAASEDVYFSRRKSRKHAVEIGYSALVRGAEPIDLLRDAVANTGWSAHPWFAYCEALVTGVSDRAAELDEVITSSSEHWSLDRMARIDLAILRVGAWELTHNPEVPAGVVISEAVHLADELSTEGSGKFINGVLGAIAKQQG